MTVDMTKIERRAAASAFEELKLAMVSRMRMLLGLTGGRFPAERQAELESLARAYATLAGCCEAKGEEEAKP